MKRIFNVILFSALLLTNACTSPPGISIKVKIEPPPPVDEPFMQKAPDAALKDVSGLVGETVTTSGNVCGHDTVNDKIHVYLGAAYPKQLLMVVLEGNAKAALENMEGKTVFVTGGIIKRHGIVQMVITDKEDFALKPQTVKPKRK